MRRRNSTLSNEGRGQQPLFAEARHIEEIALLTLLAGAAALGLWHRHQRRQ